MGMPLGRRDYRWQTAALCMAAMLIYALLVPSTNFDIAGFLLPWYQYGVVHGPAALLAGNVANYTPPYLYLLILGSAADSILAPLVIIKLIAVFGSALLACASYVVLVGFMARRTALLWSASTLLLPTVVWNGPLWGQTDAYYTAFLLLGLAAAMRQRGDLAMVSFGTALAIKLQTAFFAPVVLLLLLVGRIKAWHCLAGVLTTAAFMVPAWLAGRPALSLLLIYVEQADTYHLLSLAAPNPWTIVEHYKLLSYPTGVLLGAAMAVLATLFIAVGACHGQMFDKHALLLTALTSSALLPYVLPKMHDRYFFVADILAALVAVVRPSARTVTCAVLLQAGSLLAGSGFLFEFWLGPRLGALFTSVAVLLIIWQFVERAWFRAPAELRPRRNLPSAVPAW